MGLPAQPPPVSQNAPDRPPAGNLAAALRIRRNAARGFAVGLLFAALVFVVFVVPGARYSPVYYLGLAVVVALTAGAMVTLALVALTARRVANELD